MSPSRWKQRLFGTFANRDATEIKSIPVTVLDKEDSKYKTTFEAFFEEEPQLPPRPKQNRRGTAPPPSRARPNTSGLDGRSASRLGDDTRPVAPLPRPQPPMSSVAPPPARTRPSTSGADTRPSPRPAYNTRPMAPTAGPPRKPAQYPAAGSYHPPVSRTSSRPWNQGHQAQNPSDLRDTTRKAIFVSSQQSWFDDSEDVSEVSMRAQYPYGQPARIEERWPPRGSSRGWRDR